MKQPTLLMNIGMSLLLFVVVSTVPLINLPDKPVFSLVLALTTLIYVIYLAYNSDRKAGKVILVSCCLLALAVAFLFIKHVMGLVFTCVLIIWVVRSLLYYVGLYAILLDALLCLMGLVFASWALFNTGLFAAAIWSFFLMQSLHGLIPIKKSKSGQSEIKATNRFNKAYQTAEYIISQLINGALGKPVK